MQKVISVDNAVADVKTLLNSDISTNQISKVSELPLSQVSRVRSGKVDLESMRVYNFNKLYKAACNFDVTQL